MSERLMIEREEQIYRLCSPDFYNLTYENAALLFHCHLNTIYRTLKRLKKRFPWLFYDGFIRPRTPRNTDYVYYHPSMDGDIVMKF